MAEIDLIRLRSQELRDLVVRAINLGWAASQTGSGTVVLSSTFARGTTINVPTSRTVHSNWMRSTRNKIVRYSNPIAIKTEKLAREASKGRTDFVQQEQLAPAAAETLDKVAAPDPEPNSRIGPVRQPVPDPVPVERAEPVPDPEPGPRDAAKPSPPYAVSPYPLREGTEYKAHSVLVRRWPDGRVDYMCAVCREEYTATVPNSVSHHHSKRKDPAHEAHARLFDMEETRARIEPDAQRPSDMDPPPSPALIIERIRRLVGDDGASAALRERVRAAEERAELAERRAEEAEAARSRAEENWRALRSLVNEEGAS